MFNRQAFRIPNRVLGAIALLLLLWFTMPVAMASPTDDDDDWPEWYGLLESRPSGVEGEWVVGGRTFTATSATVLEQEHGTLQIGVCAEVEYRVIASGYQAIKISREEHHKCNSSDDDDDDDDDVERYARIESMPSSGLIGDWTIGGINYTADANTRFKQEYGGFAVGVCVELEHRRESTLLIELSTERDYKCSGSDDDDVSHGECMESLTAFPAG